MTAASLRCDLLARMSAQHDVVFVHGWMVSGKVFSSLVEVLSGVRAIVPDLLIASPSATSPPGTSLDALVAEVLAAADSEGVDRFDLVGHSMGGQIAQLVAAAAPARVRSLALLSPVPVGGLPLPPDVAAFFRSSGGSRDAQGRIVDKACLTVTPEAKSALLDDAGKIAPAWIAHTLDLFTRGGDASQLAKITCPTLVVATDDPFLPPALLEEAVVSRVKNARIEILRGPGHYPQIERRDETAAILERFWAAQGAAT